MVQTVLDWTDFDDLQAGNYTVLVDPLVPGDVGRIEMTGFGIGLLADAAGAEFIWRETFLPEGVEIVDVFGEGLNSAVVVFTVLPDAASVRVAAGAEVVAPALIAVAAYIGLLLIVILALGWFVQEVRILLTGGEGGIGPLGLLGIGSAGVGALLLFLAIRKKGS